MYLFRKITTWMPVIALWGMFSGFFIPQTHAKNTAMTDQPTESHKETALATLGGGCFWCTDAIFSRVRGVHRATPGYAGGHTPRPTYEQVVSGTTGHAEVVQIAFDPEVVSYLQLLEIFFRTHDPTTLNRQGADVGTQYRSVIFYHDHRQREEAFMVKQRLESEDIWDNPIVTEISPLEAFYEAEEYHHDYFEKNPDQAYCQMVVLPKVEQFKKMFRELLENR